MPISNWIKKLIDRVNGQDGDDGAEILVDRWPLMLRLARLVRDTSTFLSDLTELVERNEAAMHKHSDLITRLATLRYPNLAGKDWKQEIHTWMQTVYDALHELEGSPKVVVPEPPNFNRGQRRLMRKFKLGLFFVPAWEENNYPKSWVMPNWSQFASGADIQHIPLCEGWIIFEMIQKPNCQDGVYPDDKLMVPLQLQTRFNHPHSDKGEGDDLVGDILPKVFEVFKPLGGTTRIQSIEILNFMKSLFNWSTAHTADSFPDLGSTNSVELCENRSGSQSALVVGRSDNGGLTYVYSYWRGIRSVSFAFRFLVQF
jgi:hypothetical protein